MIIPLRIPINHRSIQWIRLQVVTSDPPHFQNIGYYIFLFHSLVLYVYELIQSGTEFRKLIWPEELRYIKNRDASLEPSLRSVFGHLWESRESLEMIMFCVQIVNTYIAIRMENFFLFRFSMSIFKVWTYFLFTILYFLQSFQIF